MGGPYNEGASSRAMTAMGKTEMLRMPNLMDRLKDRRKAMSDELSKVDNAISLLNRNPGVQDILNALAELNMNY